MSIPPFLIRRAVPSDGPAVRAFVFETERSYGIEPDPEGLDADVEAFGTAQNDAVLELVAEVAGKVVGSIVISRKEQEKEAWLSTFFVEAAYRGREIGRALLEQAVTEARLREYHVLVLETRSIFRKAIYLYESTGWKQLPAPPSQYGFDRKYQLVLTPQTLDGK
jgi:putative acetyltransferase